MGTFTSARRYVLHSFATTQSHRTKKRVSQLNGLVDAGNTVIAVEHDMQVAASSDWIIDIGPGAGNEGGQTVVQGTPAKVAKSKSSRTAPFLTRHVNKSYP